MNYLVLGVLIGASIFLYLLLLFLFLKPKYKKDFYEDTLVKTDDTSFAIFSTDEIYAKYIHEYKIFKYGKNRFLTLSKSENIDYVNFDITCYKDQKFLKIINVKDTNIRKQDEYLVKLPTEATSFKVKFNQINEEVFENDNLKSLPLYKEIIYSILLGVLAVLPIAFISLTVFKSNKVENSLPQEELMNFLFNQQYYYIAAGVVFALVFLLSFFIIYFNNKKYIFKYKINKKNKTNKEKKKNAEDEILDDLKKSKKEVKLASDEIKVEDYLSFKTTIKKDSKNDFTYFEIIPIKKVDLINATILIEFLDKEGELVTSIDKEIYHDFKKVKIKQEDEFVSCNIRIKRAVFKNFYIKNDGQIHKYEYVNKDNVRGCDLGFYGIFNTVLIYIVVFFASIYGTIYTNNQIEVLKNPSSLFEYSPVDEDNPNGNIKITKYIGNVSKVVVPSKIDEKYVEAIGEEAFLENETIKKIAFAGNIKIENSAFASSTLEEVDLTNVTSIGKWAFQNTKLKDVVITEKCLEVQSYAFSEVSTMKSFSILNTTKLSFNGNVLSGTKIDGDIIVNGKFSYLGTNAFKAKSFNDAYVYKVSNINFNNYLSYFYRYMNYGHIYFEKNCIHDSMSFMINNDEIITKFNSEITGETQGTCVSLGTKTYHCEYCNQTYVTNTTYDLKNHNFVDGVCVWCGKKEEVEE